MLPAKRIKRETRTGREEEHGERDQLDSKSVNDALAIFRSHFESQFRPLTCGELTFPAPAPALVSPPDEEPGSSQSSIASAGWAGFSGDEDSDGEDDDSDGSVPEDDDVEVVTHGLSNASDMGLLAPTMTRREIKAFMSSRPPALFSAADPAQNHRTPPEEDDDDESPSSAAALLANDLELQRLLAESHLLSAAGATNPAFDATISASGPSSRRTRGHQAAAPMADFSTGRARAAQQDLRLRLLSASSSGGGPGAKPSSLLRHQLETPALRQKNMPMAIRKGVVAAAATREARRRQEARKSGILLEREAAGGRVARERSRRAARGETARAQRNRRSREGGRGVGHRPVHMPGVGRLRGAELKISEREARSIQGSSSRVGKRRAGRERPLKF